MIFYALYKILNTLVININNKEIKRHPIKIKF